MKTFEQIEIERLGTENSQLRLEIAEKQQPKFDALKFKAALEQEIETARRELNDAADRQLHNLLSVRVLTLQSVQIALLRATS